MAQAHLRPRWQIEFGMHHAGDVLAEIQHPFPVGGQKILHHRQHLHAAHRLVLLRDQVFLVQSGQQRRPGRGGRRGGVIVLAIIEFGTLHRAGGNPPALAGGDSSAIQA